MNHLMHTAVGANRRACPAVLIKNDPNALMILGLVAPRPLLNYPKPLRSQHSDHWTLPLTSSLLITIFFYKKESWPS